jgi:hypothetical protein
MAIHRRVYDSSRFAEPGLERRESGSLVYFVETLAAGLVVAKGDTYIGDGESTYWAIWWNGATGQFEQLWYASDRDYGTGGAEIDAPPALIARYEAKRAADEVARRAAAEVRRVERERLEAEERERSPRFGSIVRVTRGRLVPIGLEGQVHWIGDGAYGPRAKVAFNDGSDRFIDARNLLVLRQTTP